MRNKTKRGLYNSKRGGSKFKRSLNLATRTLKRRRQLIGGAAKEEAEPAEAEEEEGGELDGKAAEGAEAEALKAKAAEVKAAEAAEGAEAEAVKAKVAAVEAAKVEEEKEEFKKVAEEVAKEAVLKAVAREEAEAKAAGGTVDTEETMDAVNAVAVAEAALKAEAGEEAEAKAAEGTVDTGETMDTEGREVNAEEALKAESQQQQQHLLQQLMGLLPEQKLMHERQTKLLEKQGEQLHLLGLFERQRGSDVQKKEKGLINKLSKVKIILIDSLWAYHRGENDVTVNADTKRSIRSLIQFILKPITPVYNLPPLFQGDEEMKGMGPGGAQDKLSLSKMDIFNTYLMDSTIYSHFQLKDKGFLLYVGNGDTEESKNIDKIKREIETSIIKCGSTGIDDYGANANDYNEADVEGLQTLLYLKKGYSPLKNYFIKDIEDEPRKWMCVEETLSKIFPKPSFDEMAAEILYHRGDKPLKDMGQHYVTLLLLLRYVIMVDLIKAARPAAVDEAGNHQEDYCCLNIRNVNPAEYRSLITEYNQSRSSSSVSRGDSSGSWQEGSSNNSELFEWLSANSGRKWLNSTSADKWLMSEEGRVWLETNDGKKWVENGHGKEWVKWRDKEAKTPMLDKLGKKLLKHFTGVGFRNRSHAGDGGIINWFNLMDEDKKNNIKYSNRWKARRWLDYNLNDILKLESKKGKGSLISKFGTKVTIITKKTGGVESYELTYNGDGDVVASLLLDVVQALKSQQALKAGGGDDVIALKKQAISHLWVLSDDTETQYKHLKKYVGEKEDAKSSLHSHYGNKLLQSDAGKLWLLSTGGGEWWSNAERGGSVLSPPDKNNWPGKVDMGLYKVVSERSLHINETDLKKLLEVSGWWVDTDEGKNWTNANKSNFPKGVWGRGFQDEGDRTVDNLVLTTKHQIDRPLPWVGGGDLAEKQGTETRYKKLQQSNSGGSIGDLRVALGVSGSSYDEKAVKLALTNIEQGEGAEQEKEQVIEQCLREQCYQKRSRSVKLLLRLAKNIDPNKEGKGVWSNKVQDEGSDKFAGNETLASPLLCAVLAGSYKCVEALLSDHRVDPVETGSLNDHFLPDRPAFSEAMKMPHTGCLTVLLSDPRVAVSLHNSILPLRAQPASLEERGEETEETETKRRSTNYTVQLWDGVVRDATEMQWSRWMMTYDAAKKHVHNLIKQAKMAPTTNKKAGGGNKALSDGLGKISSVRKDKVLLFNRKIWGKWVESIDRPINIPSNPEDTYHGKEKWGGWNGWGEWFDHGALSDPALPPNPIREAVETKAAETKGGETVAKAVGLEEIDLVLSDSTDRGAADSDDTDSDDTVTMYP